MNIRLLVGHCMKLVHKLQIIVSKMFTTQRLYNYGANNIFVQVRSVLQWYVGAFSVLSTMVVPVLVCFLLYGIPVLIIFMDIIRLVPE